MALMPSRPAQGYQPFVFTPDAQAEADKIARRRQMAQALLEQGMTPLGGTEMVSGMAVRRSPLEGIAKLAQAYVGKSEQDKSDEAMKKLATDQQQARAADLRRVSDIAGAEPEDGVQDPALRRKAIAEAMIASPYPDVQQAGYAEMMKTQTAEPVAVDAGDRVEYRDKHTGRVLFVVSKSASPDAQLREKGAQQRHSTPSGSAILNEQGQWGRWGNVSPYQQQSLANQRAGLQLQGANTYWNTGMDIPIPGIPSFAPGAGPRGPALGVPAQGPASAPAAGATAQPPAAAPASATPAGLTPKDASELKAKRIEEAPGARKALDYTNQITDHSLEQIKILKESGGMNAITGPVAGRLPSVRGESTTAQAALDALNSALSVTALQEMRDQSKTGGAVGQVTEREWAFLARAKANLIQSQTTEQFEKNLQTLEETLRRLQTRAREAYANTYGGEASGGSPGGGSGGSSGADDPLGLRGR